MHAVEAYSWLKNASEHSECDPFDIHIVRSILAVGIEDASNMNQSLCATVGLSDRELATIAQRMFPSIQSALMAMASGHGPVADQEEHSIRDIMLMYASGKSMWEPLLAKMIANRCKRPHHLWQDLGLHDRTELSQLMERHFAALVRRNANDMKWKKFLYRTVCGSEGFTLCTAPVCEDCEDFDNCFGAEDGESLLARTRNVQTAAG